MATLTLHPNAGKSLSITVEGSRYDRIPIRTHVVQRNESLDELLRTYVAPHVLPGDVVAMSERVIAITQGRSIPLDEIHPGPWARFLYKFVTKSPYGIGLASPYTMQKALEEVGLPLILFASFAAAITKPFGLRGVFYRIAGKAIAGIDGPCDYTLPPGNNAVTLSPKLPHKVAAHAAELLKAPFVVIDANDLGVAVLGVSPEGPHEELVKAWFADNPLGQASEQTPIAIIRKEAA